MITSVNLNTWEVLKSPKAQAQIAPLPMPRCALYNMKKLSPTAAFRWISIAATCRHSHSVHSRSHFHRGSEGPVNLRYLLVRRPIWVCQQMPLYLLMDLVFRLCSLLFLYLDFDLFSYSHSLQNGASCYHESSTCGSFCIIYFSHWKILFWDVWTGNDGF